MTPAEQAKAWERILAAGNADLVRFGPAVFAELLPAEITDAAREWLAAARSEGVLPQYGSAAWRELPWSDPRKTAAVFVAAEAWRDHCQPERIAAETREQLKDEDRAVLRRLRRASWDVQEARNWAESDYDAVMRRVRAAEREVRRQQDEHYQDFTRRQRQLRRSA